MQNSYSLLCAAIILSAAFTARAQYINSSGGNSFIRQYVEQSEDNWNKPIIFVFYNNGPCENCPQAMHMIYDVYQQYYADQYSYFEIDYAEDGENQFAVDYDLFAPLSIVLVDINDGMARGYEKIDNPQQWLDVPRFFEDKLTTRINNFFN